MPIHTQMSQNKYNSSLYYNLKYKNFSAHCCNLYYLPWCVQQSSLCTTQESSKGASSWIPSDTSITSSLSMSFNWVSNTSTFPKTVPFWPLFSLKSPLLFMILKPCQTRFLQLEIKWRVLSTQQQHEKK